MPQPSTSNHTPITLSVSQLNRQARNLLEGHFEFVWVEGEISNFAAPGSGHWYFSLKDDKSQVRCAMFRNRNQRLRFTPENGDAVRLRCRVSLYEARGEFQLGVEYMEHAGAGALQAAFEKLKTTLMEEGLFDQERKRPLPPSITRLGIVTSPTGAAIHDMLTVLRRRCPSIAVYLVPVAVQGEDAAPQIAAAIENANRWHREGKVELDALIVGRGGGSLEDLWAFNEEIVARAIAASELVVVSAVGHEIDFSIADMAADHRAATPSAAAEMLSPDQREFQERLAQAETQLVSLMKRRLHMAGTELAHLRKRLKHPGAQLREQAQRLDDLERRLLLSQQNRIHRLRAELALLGERLSSCSPAPRLRGLQRDLDQLHAQLESSIQLKLRESGERLGHLARMLDSLSPLGTLQRGYAIISDKQDRIVRETGSVQPGDRLSAQLAKGQLALTVDEVISED